MGAIQKLADQLADESLSTSQISSALRVLGFKTSVRGLKQALSISSALSPQFKRLKQLLGTTQQILDDFLLSRATLDALNRTDISLDLTVDTSNYSGLTKFCLSLTQSSLHQDSFKQPHVAETLAFFWYLQTALGSIPVNLSKTLSQLLRTIHDGLPELLSFEIEDDYPNLNDSKSIQECSSIQEFVENLSAPLTKLLSPLCSIKVEETKAALLEALNAISSCSDKSSYTVLPHSEIKNEPSNSIDVSSQRGIRLTERERLNSHANSFKSDELSSLAILIRNTIEKAPSKQTESVSHYFPKSGIYPPFYVEAFIIGLALATGRTISETLKFKVSVNNSLRLNAASEQIALVYLKIIGLTALWVRPITPKHSLQLPLPSFLSEPLSYFIEKHSSRLEDGLPYTKKPWAQRCYQWLDDKVVGSPHEVERKVRDALSRSIYQISASASLLTHITSTIDGRGNFESLSRYIDPLGERTYKTYEEAIAKIFHKYGSQKHLALVQIKSNTFSLSIKEHQKISGYFLSQVEHSIKSGNLISIHNSIARYCLMLLVVATGHRKSSTPFYFSWDILIEEQLAFLCDKAVVGSEARFIPLPQWVIDQFVSYRRHLFHLSEQVSISNPTLAKTISRLASGIEFSGNESPENSQSKCFGMFFTLDSSYQASTISTADLEKYYTAAQVTPISWFRRSIANQLWTDGCSGLEVDAFLGHNGQMHAFGESSSWSIAQWASNLRPIQESYLKKAGWRPAQLLNQPTKISNKILPSVSPRLETSSLSYEGRLRSKNNNRAIVRKLIRENLPDDWFQDEKSSITDTDLNTLKNRVRSMLEFNSSAVSLINLELAQQINELRAVIGTVDSPITNLTRTEPGPIEISSTRHIAIAKQLRIWWLRTIGAHTRKQNERDSILHKLAEIGISLVIFDAVLDSTLLKLYLDSIVRLEYEATDGSIFLRTDFTIASTIAERSITLTPHTAALLAGFYKMSGKFDSESISADDIIKSINKILKFAGSDLSITNLNAFALILVFRSWWQLRIPGSLHAIATANYLGPATDRHSEASILGMRSLSDSIPEESPIVAVDSVQISLGPKNAIRQLNSQLNCARGRFENLEANTRQQRSRLANSISVDLPRSLQSLASQKQIVWLMIGFIRYLLENGGPRTSTYAFSSIQTRFSSVRLLVEILWDENLYEFDAADFDRAYSTLLNASQDKKVDIEVGIVLFHNFLRDEIGAPSCRIAANTLRYFTRSRSAVISTSQMEDAWSDIGEIAKTDNQLQYYSRTAMTLGFDYGLRSKEIYGIHSKHIVLGSTVGIYVKRNAARDLKSGSSRRFVPCYFANKQRQKHLLKVFQSLRASQHGADFLFSDPVNRQQLYSTSAIDNVVVSSLRHATGNPSVVLHSTRHSAATRLAHSSFIAPREIPASIKFNLALGISASDESFFSLFDGGFNAWPFWIDRVAMILGHASADTLLNTYWHTSSCRMAEHTWHESEKDRLTDDQISNMLNQDRSTLSRKRSKLLKNPDTNPALISPYEITVAHYVTKSGIPTLGSSLDCDTQSKTKVPGNMIDTSEPFRWLDFDRLLCQRLREDLPLHDLETTATNLGVSDEDARHFVLTYKLIVAETGFDDFEPLGFNSISSRNKRFSGAGRGQSERSSGLALCQELAEKSPDFLLSLNRVIRCWIENVDFKSPWFVAKDETELNELLKVFWAIGIDSSQIVLGLYHINQSHLNRQVLSLIGEVKTSSTRFSRHAKHVITPEFGINVIQLKGAKLGDGRDMHRLAFVLAAILNPK